MGEKDDRARSRLHRRLLGLTIPAHCLIDGYSIGVSVILALHYGHSGRYLLVGLVLGAYTLATAFAEPFWGMVTDAIGRRGTVVGLGLAGASLGFSLLGFLGPEGPLAAALHVVVALAAGIGAGTYHSVATGILNDASGDEERGLIQGLNNAGGSLGRMLAPAVLTSGVLLFRSSGWATVPFLAAGLVVGTASALWLPSERKAARMGPTRGEGSLRSALSDSFVVRIGLLSFLRSAFFITASGFLPTYLVYSRHMSVETMGAVTSLAMASGIVAQPLGGRVSDRVDRARFTGVLLVLSGLAFCGFLYGQSTWLAVGLLILSMFLVLMTFPLLFALLGDTVPSEKLGLSTGLVTGVGGLAATLTQLAVGASAQRFNPTLVLLALALMGVLSGAIAFSLPKAGPGRVERPEG